MRLLVLLDSTVTAGYMFEYILSKVIKRVLQVFIIFILLSGLYFYFGDPVDAPEGTELEQALERNVNSVVNNTQLERGTIQSFSINIENEIINIDFEYDSSIFTSFARDRLTEFTGLLSQELYDEVENIEDKKLIVEFDLLGESAPFLYYKTDKNIINYDNPNQIRREKDEAFIEIFWNKDLFVS